MDNDKLKIKFKSYIMSELGYSFETFKGYRTCVNNYLDWMTANGIKAKKMSLKQTYDFLEYMRLKGSTPRVITTCKTALAHFNHSIGMESNPALMVHLAKSERKLPTRLLEEEFLDAIYKEFSANTVAQKRDRCMLGMMLFLGLQRTELALLQLEDLRLEECRLYVAPNLITNERYIALHPKQIMHLMEYVHDIRKLMLDNYGIQTNRLFFTSDVTNNLDGVLARLLPRLKDEFHYVKDFRQFKQSRMCIWVKEYGLRQAQYLGGYRYVTSVQRYDSKSVDDLKMKLDYNHPMERLSV